MSLSAAVIRELIAAGLAGEALADACDRIEAATPTIQPETPDGRRKRLARERTERWRTSQNVTERHQASQPETVTTTSPGVTERHGVTPLTRVRDNINSNLELERKKVSSSSASEIASDDWPEGRTDQILVSAVNSPHLDPHKSPNLITTAGRIQAWRRAGASWERDVVPVVSGLCAAKGETITTWQFFEKAVSRSIASSKADVEVSTPSVRTTGPPSFAERLGAEQTEARRLAFAMLDAEDGR